MRSYVAVGFFVLLFVWESIWPSRDYFKGRWIHLARNVGLGLFNAGVVALVIGTCCLSATVWTYNEQFGLLYHIGMPVWTHVVIIFLVYDLWMYAWHRINHLVPFFWRFHRMHHTDPSMDVTTAVRFHTGEVLMSSVFQIPLIFLLGVQFWELLVYGSVFSVVVQFHHSNVRLPERIDRVLRVVVATPGMHRVHHSRYKPETNSNYGSVFSFWDRLFRSYVQRARSDQINPGLDGWDGSEYQKLPGLLKTPLQD